jgi:hypothetical protein
VPDRPTYSFGEPNWTTIGRWLHLDPADDGPVWMLNLMKYRKVAAYGDAGATAVSGKEADDAYAPLGPLAAVGAYVVFFGDVTAQLSGEPGWERVAMVRYPTRSAFFTMQERDDYKEKFVHKEAGMEFTIIMGCLPDGSGPVEAPSADGGELVVRVRRWGDGGSSGGAEDGVTPVARFRVDGVVLGDDRTWDEVRIDRVDRQRLTALPDGSVDEEFVCVVEPRLDRVLESIAGGAAPG